MFGKLRFREGGKCCTPLPKSWPRSQLFWWQHTYTSFQRTINLGVMVGWQWLIRCDLTQIDQVLPDFIQCSQNRKWHLHQCSHVISFGLATNNHKALAETHQYVCMQIHRYVWQLLLKTKLPVGLSLRCFFLLGVLHFLWKIPRVHTNKLLIALLCVNKAGRVFAATGPCWSLRYFQSCSTCD